MEYNTHIAYADMVGIDYQADIMAEYHARIASIIDDYIIDADIYADSIARQVAEWFTDTASVSELQEIAKAVKEHDSDPDTVSGLSEQSARAYTRALVQSYIRHMAGIAV